MFTAIVGRGCLAVSKLRRTALWLLSASAALVSALDANNKTVFSSKVDIFFRVKRPILITPHIFWLIYVLATAALPSVSLYIFPLSIEHHQANPHSKSKTGKKSLANSAHYYEAKKNTTVGLWGEGSQGNPSCLSKLLIF